MAPRPSLRSEDGYSLLEGALVLALLAVIFSAVIVLLDKTTELFPRDAERGVAIRDAQTGLNRITRDLRQAYLVDSPAAGVAADVVTFEAELQGVERRITVDCTKPSLTEPALRRCERTFQAVAGGPVKRDTVVDRVTNTGIFDRTAERTFDVRIEVPATGERDSSKTHRIVLDDGVLLRNVAG